jgi:HPt (histidine-containing phosphotransfer) domain-containing protein
MAAQRPFEKPVPVRASSDEDTRGHAIRFPRHAYPDTRFPRFVAIRIGESAAETPRIAAGGAWGGAGYSPDGDGVLLSADLFDELDAAGAAQDRDARWIYAARARPREVVRHAKHLRGPALVAGIVAAAAVAALVEQTLSSEAPVVALVALVLGMLAAVITAGATVALAARS